MILNNRAFNIGRTETCAWIYFKKHYVFCPIPIQRVLVINYWPLASLVSRTRIVQFFLRNITGNLKKCTAKKLTIYKPYRQRVDFILNATVFYRITFFFFRFFPPHTWENVRFSPRRAVFKMLNSGPTSHQQRKTVAYTHGPDIFFVRTNDPVILPFLNDFRRSITSEINKNAFKKHEPGAFSRTIT